MTKQDQLKQAFSLYRDILGAERATEHASIREGLEATGIDPRPLLVAGLIYDREGLRDGLNEEPNKRGAWALTALGAELINA